MHLYRHAEQNKVAPVVNHARTKDSVYSDWMKTHVCPRNRKQIGGVNGGAHKYLVQKWMKPKESGRADTYLIRKWLKSKVVAADLRRSRIGGSQELKNRRNSGAQESADLWRSRIGGSPALKNRRMK